jgi:hypothetical protein
MTNRMIKNEYSFGSSYVIVNEKNEVIASCKTTDHEKYNEIVRRYKPLNASPSTPLYLVG